MGDLLPTEDENVLDKLTSKNRQLFFLLGRQNDQEKKKRICAQIKATIYEIKQRRPYQRYKDLQTQEIKMRKLLEEIQSLLDRYLSRKKMLQDEREKMRGIKQGYQKMINEVKKSQELQQKIQKINIQIHEGKEITSHLQKGEIVDHYSSLTKTKDMLISRNKILSEKLKNIKQQIKILQQEINRDQDRWDELLEEKKRLLMQLYEAQGNRLNYQVLQASTLGKSSTASSKSGELSGYSLRGKKKLIGQSEILLKGEDNKKIYVIWMIILVIWFIWLILLRWSEKQDLDNVCL